MEARRSHVDVPAVGHMGPDERQSRFRAVLGIVFRPSSPTFDPMSSSNALRPCLNRAGEEALPSLFGNHPIPSGFLRKISSRTIMAIPTTEKDRDKPSSHFRHIYASVCTSYAAVCSPYALYAPLLGVGPFSALFLLREVHTVHTAAYGSHRNQALALLPVGIEASSACENRKCIRNRIRLSVRIARRIGGFPVPRRGRMSGTRAGGFPAA